MIERITIVPLAITLDASGNGCVAGVNQVTNKWIRPEPVSATDVQGIRRKFDLFSRSSLTISPAVAPDARVEDRTWLRDESSTIDEGSLGGEERSSLLSRVGASSVKDAFNHERSVGAINVEILGVYAGRSTGKRTFHRIQFRDATGQNFDWIARDVRLLEEFPQLSSPDGADQFRQFGESISGINAVISVGLTKPNHRFPGQFRGCHPLVVGILTEIGRLKFRHINEESANG